MTKLFFAALVFVVTFFAGCSTVDLETRKVDKNVCYYGEVNPADLTDQAKYQIVKKDGNPVALPGPGFYIIGFHTTQSDAKVKHVLAIVTPNGIVGVCYKVGGKWYPFSYDPRQQCFTYDGDDAVTGDAEEALEKINQAIFEEEIC